MEGKWESFSTLELEDTDILQIFFTPDATRGISVNADQSLSLWDITRNLELFKFSIGIIPESYSLSPNGSLFAIGGFSGKIKIWNLETLKELVTIQNHHEPVTAITFSSDNKKLISASNDGNIQFWDLESFLPETSLNILTKYAADLCISTDGTMLVINEVDKKSGIYSNSTITIFDLQKKQIIEQFEETSELLTQILHINASNFQVAELFPQNQLLKISSFQEKKRFGLISSLKKIEKASINTTFDHSSIFVIAPSGILSAIKLENNSVSIWNVIRQIQMENIQFEKTIVKLTFSSNSKILAITTGDGKAILHSNDQRMIKRFKALAEHEDNERKRLIQMSQSMRQTNSLESKLGILAVEFSVDGKYMAAASERTTLKLWKMPELTEIGQLGSHWLDVRSIAFTKDSVLMASGSNDKTIKIWNVLNLEELGRLEGHKNIVIDVAFSPIMNLLISASADGTIKFWSIETFSEIHSIDGHNGIVMSVSFSPDGNTIISGSEDRLIHMWDANTYEKIGVLKGHERAVTCVKFHPDGKCLASASEDNVIILWNAETKLEMGRFVGHGSVVNSIDFSPDGALLVSGSEDNTVRIWRVENQTELKAIHGGTWSVRDVKFSPSGNLLAITDADESVQLWTTEVDEINNYMN